MSLRRQFEENYRAEQTLRPNGKGLQTIYVYCGDWYIWDPPTARLRQIKSLICAIGLIDLMVYLCAALHRCAANTMPLVAAGGMLGLVCLMFEIIGLIQFVLSTRKVKDPDCHEIRTRLIGSSLLRAILLAISAVTCMTIGAYWPGIGYGICAVLSICMYSIAHQLTFTLLPGDGSILDDVPEEDWSTVLAAHAEACDYSDQE